METLANALSDFLHQSPTPYHAVAACRQELQELSDFCELHEADSWPDFTQAQSSGRGFFCRRGGSLIAWVCGSRAPWESGFRLGGAHTDSPAFKLKLESAYSKHGVCAAHISVYGSPIFATYFDRSLAVAGIAVRSDGHETQTHLIHTHSPVAVIPNLAIHLNRDANSKLAYNPQTQIQAIFGLQKDLSVPLLHRELGLEDDEVAELQLCSAAAPELLGLDRELLSGSRLDDLSMVYLLLQAIRSKAGQPNAGSWPVVLFCNGEEVGSRTYEGAASNFANSVLQRIARSTEAADAWPRTQARSFLLSLDGAHASHPAYSEAFDPDYSLKMGHGPAIKLSSTASYSSEAHSIATIRALAKSSQCPLQLAVPRSDKATGSTIGPILSSQLGMRGVDIGLPMYAMHSIQETISLADYLHLSNLVCEYFR